MAVTAVTAVMAMMARRHGIAPARGWLVEAGIAWALLATLVFGVDPNRLSHPTALLILIGPLFGCLASPALLWAIWREPSELWWYRRRGYLCAGCLCALFVLQALHLLTPPRIALFSLAAVVMLLLRWRAHRVGAAPSSGQPGAAPQLKAAPAASSTLSSPPRTVQPIGRGSR